MTSPHGGDRDGFKLLFGKEPLDFSASLNPLGMPPAVNKAAHAAVDQGWGYPDPYARELTTALSTRLQVDAEWLIFGNGAADLIYRYVQAVKPQHALLVVPTFAEYERALQSAGTHIRYHQLEESEGFRLTEAIVPEITQDLDVLFLCQPGNPTGCTIEPQLLDTLLATCGRTGTRLFLDECFIPFLPHAHAISKTSSVAEYPELFILNSFTKIYGMAGLRLGYGLSSDTALIESLRQNSQHWPLSNVAQAAGVAALSQDAFVEESLALIQTEKQRLQEELEHLGYEVFGSEANYLFYKTKDTQHAARLAEQGIMVRDCSNYQGLEQGYYRIAVLDEAANSELIHALRVLSDEGGAK